jgi:hypothetical protein
MLPALRLTPPPSKWGADELAINAFHHAVSALATGVAFDGVAR